MTKKLISDSFINIVDCLKKVEKNHVPATLKEQEMQQAPI
jgi:hypothetical protein